MKYLEARRTGADGQTRYSSMAQKNDKAEDEAVKAAGTGHGACGSRQLRSKSL